MEVLRKIGPQLLAETGAEEGFFFGKVQEWCPVPTPYGESIEFKGDFRLRVFHANGKDYNEWRARTL